MLDLDFVVRFCPFEEGGPNGRFLPLSLPKIDKPHPNHWDLTSFTSARFTLVGRGVIWNWLGQPAAPDDFWHCFQEGFLAQGLNFVAQLRGQFSIVLYDKQTQTGYAIRDQVGSYPLYYAQSPSGLLISSRLSDMRPHLPEVKLSLLGAAHFFRLGYVHASQTMLEGVYKLLPGQCLITRSDGQPETIRYWSLAPYAPQPKSPTDFLAETRHRIIDILAKQIAGRDQLGIFLSGGIDSSLILALLVHHFKRDPHAFTFGLNVVYERANYLRDLPYAREMAASAAVPYHELLIDQRFPVQQLLLEIIPQLDSLLITPNIVTKYWLTKQAAAQGVTTLLTGSSSTTGFDAFSEKSFRKKKFDPQLPFQHGLARFRRPVLTTAEIRGLLPQAGAKVDGLPYDALAPYWDGIPSADRAYQFENGLFWASGAEKGWPVHMDLGRRLGIDFKLPLADTSCADFKSRVPRYLLAGDETYTDKYLLKEAFRDIVPASICERHSGVGYPSYYWFQGELADLHKVLFSPDVLGLVPELETAVLHQIVADEQFSTRKSKGKRTWGITVFLLWYLHFIKGESLASVIQI